MWKRVADDLRFNIPSEHLEQIAPVLDALLRDIRRILEHDLSTTDPVTTFRPDGL